MSTHAAATPHPHLERTYRKSLVTECDFGYKYDEYQQSYTYHMPKKTGHCSSPTPAVSPLSLRNAAMISGLWKAICRCSRTRLWAAPQAFGAEPREQASLQTPYTRVSNSGKERDQDKDPTHHLGVTILSDSCGDSTSHLPLVHYSSPHTYIEDDANMWALIPKSWYSRCS